MFSLFFCYFVRFYSFFLNFQCFSRSFSFVSVCTKWSLLFFSSQNKWKEVKTNEWRGAEMNAARYVYPKGRREGERVRKRHSSDGHSTVGKKMTKFINLPLCTWIVVCCCSTADCNERKLSLALAMGWRRRSSRKFEEKPYDTAGERPRANEEQGANQHKDNKSMKQE